MIEELFDIESAAYRESRVHRLDARVKIIVCFSAIIATVALPYTSSVYIPGLLMLTFFCILWAFSELPPSIYGKRLLLILPFGFFIILFQIFFKNSRYTDFHVLVQLPLGINIYAESVEFASILAVKFIICVSFIILLSSTTRMHDMLAGAARLGIPKEFTLILGMMIRYLFVFAGMFKRMQSVFATRCFEIFDRKIPYKYRLMQLSHAIGTFFIRSFEQGERTYTAMLCRGYGHDSGAYVGTKKVMPVEWVFLVVSLACFVAISLYAFIPFY